MSEAIASFGIVHAAVAPAVLLMVVLGVLGQGHDPGKLGHFIHGTFGQPPGAADEGE